MTDLKISKLLHIDVPHVVLLSYMQLNVIKKMKNYRQ